MFCDMSPSLSSREKSTGKTWPSRSTKLRRKSATSSEDPEPAGPPPGDARPEELLGPPASESASISVIGAGIG